MDIPDWGTSLLHCQALGERAQVVLDTGHHAPGTNIEFIVMQLQRVGKLGAFDFNSRYYADDDLDGRLRGPVPAVPHPERDRRGRRRTGRRRGINFMLDQCHNIEEKIPGQIRSVLNVAAGDSRRRCWSTATRWPPPQRAGDVLGAHAVLMDAYDTDVRGGAGRPARGAAACRATRWPPTPRPATPQRIAAERVGGTQASWGS